MGGCGKKLQVAVSETGIAFTAIIVLLINVSGIASRLYREAAMCCYVILESKRERGRERKRYRMSERHPICSRKAAVSGTRYMRGSIERAAFSA